MSGIAGFLDLSGATPDRRAVVGRMAAALGDAPGSEWIDVPAGIALTAGHPPILSRDGRWVVVLEGAILNRADLRRRLEPVDWQGGSDADIVGDAATLAEAVARWGVERALQAADGLFAVALWDRIDRTLHLARDRFGEKPLCWSLSAGILLFGSRLTALAAHPAFDAGIDRDALALYLRLGWIPAPHTIHPHARKLEPGHLLTVRGPDHVIRPYWTAAGRAAALAGGFTGGVAAAAERLNGLLRASVAMRLHGDRPAGMLLSGGPASTLLAGIAHDLGISPTTITLEIEGTVEIEGRSSPAAPVAAHLGGRHLAVPVDGAGMPALIPRLAAPWDEPPGDPGVVEAQVLAEAAAAHAGIALSGEGADLLFGTLPLHGTVAAQWERARRAPPWRRRLAPWLGRLMPDAALLGAQSAAQMLGLARSLWHGLPAPVPNAHPAPTVFEDGRLRLDDPALELRLADILATLPDCVCPRSDRPASALGVEMRRPFLDPALADFAWSLPPAAAAAALDQALCRYLPADLAERAAGAPPDALPLERWLAGPLAEWAGDLLSEDRLRRQGWLAPAAITRARRAGRLPEVWAALMFQSWLDSHPA